MPSGSVVKDIMIKTLNTKELGLMKDISPEIHETLEKFQKDPVQLEKELEVFYKKSRFVFVDIFDDFFKAVSDLEAEKKKKAEEEAKRKAEDEKRKSEEAAKQLSLKKAENENSASQMDGETSLVGRVVEIEPTHEAYLGFMNDVHRNGWEYNGITAIKEDEKWLLLIW